LKLPMKSLPLIAALGVALFAGPAAPQGGASTDRVRTLYQEPTEPKHLAIRAEMQQRGVLEVASALLSAFRLPRELTIEVTGCGGREGAYYANDKVVFCYEYAELVQRHSPKVATPWGVARADAIFGGILDTILHEVGHAVFEMLEIPVFGREEDAADFFSVYLLLQFPPEDAQRLIQGLAFTMGSEAREEAGEKIDARTFAGVHAMNAQRYYNVLCLAYGANPALVGNEPPPGMSSWRASNCADEYAMLKRAFTKLILPHVDEAKQRAAIEQVRFNWSPLVAARESLDKPPIE
jgi:hypothetical protein